MGRPAGGCKGHGGRARCAVVLRWVINKRPLTKLQSGQAARRRYRCDRCENQAEGKGGEYKSKVGAGGRMAAGRGMGGQPPQPRRLTGLARIGCWAALQANQ